MWPPAPGLHRHPGAHPRFVHTALCGVGVRLCWGPAEPASVTHASRGVQPGARCCGGSMWRLLLDDCQVVCGCMWSCRLCGPCCNSQAPPQARCRYGIMPDWSASGQAGQAADCLRRGGCTGRPWSSRIRCAAEESPAAAMACSHPMHARTVCTGIRRSSFSCAALLQRPADLGAPHDLFACSCGCHCEPAGRSPLA